MHTYSTSACGKWLELTLTPIWFSCQCFIWLHSSSFSRSRKFITATKETTVRTQSHHGNWVTKTSMFLVCWRRTAYIGKSHTSTSKTCNLHPEGAQVGRQSWNTLAERQHLQPLLHCAAKNCNYLVTYLKIQMLIGPFGQSSDSQARINEIWQDC